MELTRTENQRFSYEEVKKIFNDEKTWGLSTTVDLYDCDPDLIKNGELIKKFVIEVCDKLDVKRFGEPTIVKFGDDPKVTGYSMVQLIESSLVSGHFADNSNAVYLDIFSCKAYDTNIIVDYAKEFFKAKDVRFNIIFRR